MSYLRVQYSLDRQPLSRFPDALVGLLMAMGLVERHRPLLELGFGRGDFLRAWRRAGVIARGADLDCQFEREQTDEADIARQRWPYPAAAFDVVFSKSLIEHIAEPAHMMLETWRVLRPGGRLIVMTPDWRTYMRTFYDDYTHVRPYDQVSLADLLAAYGFSQVRCTRIYQYPALWPPTPLRPLAVLWRWFVPVEFSLWLSRTTGCGFFRWASQLSVLAVGNKPEIPG
jgi:SAM-dependent methyltransferase